MSRTPHFGGWFRTGLLGVPPLALLACFGAAQPSTSDDNGGPSADGSVYVDANVPVDADCAVSTDSRQAVSIGMYDIAASPLGNTPPDAAACAHAYLLNLRVNSTQPPYPHLGPGESGPANVQIHAAEVTLKTVDREVIAFADLPNPFSVTTSVSLGSLADSGLAQGIASIEAIPVAFAGQLRDFVGKEILIETVLFGRALAEPDAEFDIKPFVSVVEICDGCLSVCLDRDIISVGMQVDDVLAGACPAEVLSGMDGRVCIDSGC